MLEKKKISVFSCIVKVADQIRLLVEESQQLDSKK